MVGPGSKSPGGMLTVAENYCEGFSSFDEIEVRYVGIGTRGSFVSKCAYYAKQLVLISKLLKTVGFDICHVHMGDKGGVFRSGIVVELAKRHGCKTITHLHAGNMMLWYETLGTPAKAVVRSFLNASDSFVVLGNLWKSQLADLVPAEKIEVIYNGVSLPEVERCGGDRLTFLYLGVLKKQKGLSELLDAVSNLRERFEGSARLLVAGTVFDFDIEAEIEARGLDGLVEYVGWAGPQEKAALFKKADIAVLPSYYEGLPMSVLETMASGLPPITTPVGAIPEVIESGRNGILVRPKSVTQLEDAMLAFLDDEGLAIRLGKAARETIERRFTIAGQLKATAALYDELSPAGVE